MQVCTNLRKTAQIYASLRKSMRVCANLCKSLRIYGSLCKFMWVFSNLCKFMKICVNLNMIIHNCVSLYQSAQIFKNQLEFAYVCTGLHKCAQICKRFASLWEVTQISTRFHNFVWVWMNMCIITYVDFVCKKALKSIISKLVKSLSGWL
mgnify:CR=1 FL=1